MMPARPVIFGEVLFDCFAEEATLGGAPFNVAWHLQGFGANPLFISRIGEDKPGQTVFERMQRWGMDTTGLQQDQDRPTGAVQVKLHENEPYYEIVPDQAYDFVDVAGTKDLVQQEGLALLYHGTLALRNGVSREALCDLRRRSGLPVFVDINLRTPWWQMDLVTSLIEGIACLKVNEAELKKLAGPGADLHALAAALKTRLKIDALVVTLGEKGAFALAEGERYETAAPRVEPMVDPVGAGDAFSAVVILGILRNWPWVDTLERAAAFAAEITCHRGAIEEDRRLYQRAEQRWTAG